MKKTFNLNFKYKLFQTSTYEIINTELLFNLQKSQ